MNKEQQWKLVPVEPTDEMIDAGRNEPLAGEADEDAPEDYRAVFKAMLAAAPQPPALGGEPEVLRGRLNAARSRFERWNGRLLESLRSERAHVTRLQAEVERLVEREAAVMRASIHMANERDTLKARTAELEALLREFAESSDDPDVVKFASAALNKTEGRKS